MGIAIIGILIVALIMCVIIKKGNEEAANVNMFDTYSLIAQNITLFYLAVKYNPRSQSLPLRERLTITCIMDIAPYLKEGTITETSMYSNIDVAMHGSIPNDEPTILTNVCGGIEILIFAADSDFSMDAISEAVTAKKSVIERVVRSTLRNGMATPAYQIAVKKVDEALDVYFLDE